MKNPLLFFALFCICACNCKDKLTSRYEGCCGAVPTNGTELVQSQHLVFVQTPDTAFYQFQDTMIEAHIYISNLFLPANGAGIDEIFMVFGGEGIRQVQSAVMTGGDGDVFFSADSFLVNDVSYGWSGLKPDGTVHYGPFHYEVKVEFIDGQTKTYTGDACAYKCGDSDFPDDRLPDCFFPSQNNGNGQADGSLPYFESCFQ